MAKTVFGMPGVGDKAKGGDAIAPEGAPGAKSNKDLPQKAGNEPLSQRPAMKPEAEPKPAQAKPKPAQAKPHSSAKTGNTKSVCRSGRYLSLLILPFR